MQAISWRAQSLNLFLCGWPQSPNIPPDFKLVVPQPVVRYTVDQRNPHATFQGFYEGQHTIALSVTHGCGVFSDKTVTVNVVCDSQILAVSDPALICASLACIRSECAETLFVLAANYNTQTLSFPQVQLNGTRSWVRSSSFSPVLVRACNACRP